MKLVILNYRLYSGSAIGILCLTQILSPHSAQGETMPNLSKYELVFRDDFDAELNAYRDGKGLWSTSPRRDDLMTNGPQSVFLSDVTATSDGTKIGLNPLNVANGSLNISSGVIPDDKKPLVQQALEDIGKGDDGANVKYYTGMVSTAETWAQAYGYYEITAEIPVGKGHWPAFWLAPSGIGWPPEIDIFEIYSKGVGGSTTRKDNTFSTAAFFDRVDINGESTQSVDWKNPYDLDQNGNPRDPMVKNLAGGEQYIFQHTTNAQQEFGADIYSGKWTWAAEWTPDYIAFYFGKDRDSMVEIYRTPTPADLKTPMYTIINDQISSTWGWNPEPGLDHLTFAPGNDFSIDTVSVYALRPTNELRATTVGAVIVDDETGSQIIGSRGNDIIVTGGGAGQDFVALGGGKDIVHVSRGTGNVILSEFGADDRIVIEGFNIDGAAGAMARLTQVGGDVWLTNGAYPSDPQTIVFRDRQVSDFTEGQFVVRWSETPNVWSSRLADSKRIGDTDGDGVVRALESGSRLIDTGGNGKDAITLIGGASGDEFSVHRGNTVVSEQAQGGVDTVYTSRSYTLTDHVENLIAMPGLRGGTLAGNAGDNRIEGNDHSNILQGGLGNDLLITKAGADVIAHRFGDGHDVVTGFSANDRIRLDGYAARDVAELMSRLVQIGDDVRLDLGQGGSITFRDTALAVFDRDSFAITPGGGNAFGRTQADPYAVPTVTAVRPSPGLELPDDGIKPTIQGSERNDTLPGAATDDVILGHAGNDVLRGMAGDDWLDGGIGTNHLNGGIGNDTLVASGVGDHLFGAAGADVFVLTDASRGTRVMDFAAGDQLDLSQLADSTDQVRLIHSGVWAQVSVLDGATWGEVGRVRTADVQDIWDGLLLA